MILATLEAYEFLSDAVKSTKTVEAVENSNQLRLAFLVLFEDSINGWHLVFSQDIFTL